MMELTVAAPVFAGLVASPCDHVARTIGAAHSLNTAVALIPYLTLAYIVVMGGAAFAHVWELLRIRNSSRLRRSRVVPTVAVIELQLNNGEIR